MPGWIVSLLLSLVMKFGIPWIAAWLKKRFGIGGDSQVVQVLADFVEEAKSDKAGAKRRAKRRLKECVGAGCPIDTVQP